MKENKKVIKFHNLPAINIGVIIFCLIFVFLGVQIFRSMKQEHISVYEVQKSYIDTNIAGSAIALRQEVLVPADASGYVNYYIRNGQRVAKNATVYTLDTTGTLSDLIAETSGDGTTLNHAGYSEIQSSISAFQNYFSDANFSDVYEFKNELESHVLDLANTQVLETLTSGEGTGMTFSQIRSTESGVVTFFQDGYEGKTPTDITGTDFQPETYEKLSLKTGEVIQTGSPVYKLITSENWNLVLPLSAEDAARLQEDTRVTLLLPGITHEVYGDIAVIQNGEEYFANISLDKLMINFCDERFLPIEIVMDKQEGLTIPNTSILEKQVLMIPIAYLTAGSNSTQKIYFNVRVLDEEGNLSVTQIAPAIYNSDENFCYVNPDDFDANAILVMNNSEQTLAVADMERTILTGVYNVNRGIASFQQITILTANNDFTIVEDKIPGSLSMYDRIILDASLVEEGQIIQ